MLTLIDTNVCTDLVNAEIAEIKPKQKKQVATDEKKVNLKPGLEKVLQPGGRHRRRSQMTIMPLPKPTPDKIML